MITSIWPNPTQQTRNKKKYPQLINGIDKKPTANIVLKLEDGMLFPKYQKDIYPFSPFLCSISLEILVSAISQEVEVKGIQTGKEE